MDSDRFDRLAKSLSTTGTRRALLRLLATVPVAGGLLALLAPAPAAAKKAKGKSKSKNTTTNTNGVSGGDSTSTSTTTNTNTSTNSNESTNSNTNTNTNTATSTSTDPGCPPTTCAEQGTNCGSIPDGCGGTLDCGTCPLAGQPCTDNVCGPCVENCGDKRCGADNACGGTCQNQTCPVCQICSGGTCAQDPSQDGDCCGTSGAGTRCQGGDCVPATATTADCQGLCETDQGQPAQVTIRGQPATCPGCEACPCGPGCKGTGPNGFGFYCVGGRDLGFCPSGTCPGGQFCCGGFCQALCTS
jgi:hypothetical protein